MAKLIVLKPVLWNPTGYMGPSGEVTSSGYAERNGYGHEEWNGRDDWVWRGWRVFDTQSQPRLHQYAATGELGIIMITVVDGRPCVVGAGCNVYGNTAKEQQAIARELRLKGNGAKVWALPAVQDRFDNRAAFNAHWNSAYSCVRWRCPVTHYHWLRERAYFNPNDIAPRDPPREKVVAMHSSYQAVQPERADALLAPHLPPSHPILAWLSEGEFDIVENGRSRRAGASKASKSSAATAVDPYTRYLQENEVLITPKHHALQEAFAAYLRSSKATKIEANKERVDLRFALPKADLVLAEIKPTEPSTVRFAIRSAMGQLLDYKQKCGKPVQLLVVIGDKPDHDDLALALDNGFGIAWPNAKGFDWRWPTGSKTQA